MIKSKKEQTRIILKDRISMLTTLENEEINPSKKRRYNQCINETKKLL